MKKITTLFALLTLFAFGAMSQVVVFGQIDSARLTTAGGLSGTTPVDSGKLIQIHGTVYGPNSYPTVNGQSFWLNDGTAGIKVYSKHVFADYPTVNNGDQVTVVGVLTDYYGSAEVDLIDTIVDTIIYNGAGVMDTPIVLSFAAFSPQTYGTLVRVNNVNFTGVTGWGSTTKHYFTANANNVYVYVDSFTNDTLFHMAAPTGMYDVIGIADDYSPTEFNLDPRYTTDFIQLTTGIENINELLSAAIYPNPTSTLLNVTLGNDRDESITAKMYDVTGQLVLSETRNLVNGSNHLEFNTANFTNGMYILELRTAEKSLNTKIVVTK